MRKTKIKSKTAGHLSAVIRNIWHKTSGKYLLACLAVLCCNLVYTGVVLGQDGVSGINEATNKVRGYFDAGGNLMYAIGAVVGIIGAVKVYNKWSRCLFRRTSGSGP